MAGDETHVVAGVEATALAVVAIGGDDGSLVVQLHPLVGLSIEAGSRGSLAIPASIAIEADLPALSVLPEGLTPSVVAAVVGAETTSVRVKVRVPRAPVSILPVGLPRRHRRQRCYQDHQMHLTSLLSAKNRGAMRRGCIYRER